MSADLFLGESMENIAQFLNGAKELGVPPHDLFQTVDLFEKKNMTQVLQILHQHVHD